MLAPPHHFCFRVSPPLPMFSSHCSPRLASRTDASFAGKMAVEVQETVRFLSSFMFGRIPRSRVKSFCAHLSSLLSEAIEEKNVADRFDLIVFADGKSDDTIVQAARRAYVRLGELQECMNNGLIIELMDGRVRALTPFSAQIVFPKMSNTFGY